MNDIIKKILSTGNVVLFLALTSFAFATMLLPLDWRVKNLSAAWFCILYASVWDSIGFYLTQDRDADVSLNRAWYRVIQNITQWPMYVLVSFYTHSLVGVGCALAWWMLTNDYLFYIIRGETLDLDFTSWTSWSMPQVLFRIKPVTKGWVLFFAYVGMLIATGFAFIKL